MSGFTVLKGGALKRQSQAVKPREELMKMYEISVDNS